MFLAVLLIINRLFSIIYGDISNGHTLHIKMPNVQIMEEINLCTSLKIQENIFITEFTPEPGAAHHMIIYGCKMPGSQKEAWKCVGMTPAHVHSDMEHLNDIDRKYSKNKLVDSIHKHKHSLDPGKSYRKSKTKRRLSKMNIRESDTMTNSDDKYGEPICGNGERKLLYSWSHDGKGLRLPDEVSYPIDVQNSSYYLVLNAHYREKYDEPDSSGIKISYSKTETAKSAGMILFGSSNGNIITTGKNELFANCLYNGDLILNPFAYRVHTHEHGTRVSEYRIRNGISKLIGARDPQLPQSFVSVEKEITIEKGDFLKMICEMENLDDDELEIGLSADQEMCNFYLLYWVEKPNYASFALCSA